MTYESAVDADADTDRIERKALRSTRVELEPIGLTEHGQRYRVTYASAAVHRSTWDRSRRSARPARPATAGARRHSHAPHAPISHKG
jgi:hypothetical protein